MLTTSTGGSITFTVTYSDADFADSTLRPEDVQVLRTGLADAKVAVSGTGLVRTITLYDVQGPGTLAIALAAGTAVDLAGNRADAAAATQAVAVHGDLVVNGTAGDDSLSVSQTPGGGVGDVTYVLNGNRLLDYVQSRLAHYKCPKAIDFDRELPREQTGKLYKRLLRDRYWGNKTSRIV